MSQAEIERFVNDLASNESLRETVVNASEGVESLVAIAQDHGYDINIDEARDYIQANTQGELSDDQLDAVAGGKTAVATNVVQSAEVATSAVVAAETAAVVAVVAT
ncbi:Nif11-like leader peptide family natural product precursor [Spiribacter sp. C176]|uniref:Nif11-like leader peptide family natural product n=1 Tax=Spiribacter salilacus TaxID=2664894 RepID=A0A6N7QRD0_9GAMM|nr:Nif11-like leader peptide family natural product precursor [Spiribacter salilacus]MRH79011.1 Nif11-like leader peptide family natural product precursor [Spiribacter salilacus]